MPLEVGTNYPKMVSRILKECTTLFYFYFSPILKSLVVRVYDLIKDPRMLVAIRSMYELTLRGGLTILYRVAPIISN